MEWSKAADALDLPRYARQRFRRLSLAVHLVDFVRVLLQLQRLLSNLRQILWTQSRALSQDEGFAFRIVDGADPDSAHSGCVVLALVPAFRLERAPLVSYQHVLVTADRNTGLRLHFEDFRAIQEVDVRRPTLEILRCSQLRVCRHEVAGLGLS